MPMLLSHPLSHPDWLPSAGAVMCFDEIGAALQTAAESSENDGRADELSSWQGIDEVNQGFKTEAMEESMGSQLPRHPGRSEERPTESSEGEIE
jgi:hypothetical protein